MSVFGRAGIAIALLLTLSGFACPPACAQDCAAAAVRAEREHAIPVGLLGAIGRVESGRADPLSPRGGIVAPWPWTVNDAGSGRFFPSKQEAMTYVARRLAEGARSLDLGCFQVNLLYHPLAFASLAEAFDPEANARAAAAFLAALHAKSGNWAEAVGWYHSATPWRAGPYRASVLARWTGGPDAVGADLPALRKRASWTVPLPFGIHVQRPGAGAIEVSLFVARPRLPRVIRPGG